MKITLDFETRSASDLKREGAYKYSLHPSTKPTCLSFKRPDGPVRQLKFHEINKHWRELPNTFTAAWEHLINSGNLFSAHNAFFEIVIYRNILVRRYGWPDIPFRQWRCTAAKAAACALPRSLEGAGNALNLKTQKDKFGHAAVMATCKPTRQWNAWVKKGKIGPEPPMFLEPQAGPEVWKRLYHYNQIDTLAEEELDQTLPDLSAQEQEIWFLNIQMNWRGIRIDIPTVKKIIGLMEAEGSTRLKELDHLTMGAVTKPGARQSILDFLEAEGVKLKDIRAKTVEDALKNIEISESARRLLELRKLLSKTSTRKYQAFINRANLDNRVRDIQMYHGASTGRDSGTGVQFQNLPRPLIKQKEINHVLDVLTSSGDSSGDMEWIKCLYGDPALVFSSLIRSMLIPSAGKEIFVADYSKIEVCVLWWLADNKPGLRVLHAGKDPYIYMAAANTGKTYQEIERAVEAGETWAVNARALGKAQVLGCFEADTLVLTQAGWKPIINVKPRDRVWDGEEWVKHGGVIYQGEKSTIRFQGVGVTPDHQILTPEGWRSAFRVARDKSLYRRSMIDLDCSGLKALKSDRAAVFKEFWSLVFALLGLRTRLISTILEKALVQDAPTALKKLQRKLESIFGVTQILSPKTLTENVSSIGFPQPYNDAITQKIKVSKTTERWGFSFINRGAKTEENFYSTLSVSMAGTNLIKKWTGSKILKGIYRATLDSQPGIRIPPTGGILGTCRKEFSNSKKKMPVFDIMNSGPRNRFTIKTNDGPLIVHNCGFGMGFERFLQTAWDMYRLKLTEEQSRFAVSSYREANPAVPLLWKNYERAAIAAIEDKKSVTINKCTFFIRDNFLWIRLPSGRKLAYRNPSIGMRENDWGPQKTLEYWGVNPKTKKWAKEVTFGGKIAENIVQANARDLMVSPLPKLEKLGYQVLLTVHDEVIAEREIDKGSVREFCSILCAKPFWADNHLPLEAKGWKGMRYRK